MTFPIAVSSHLAPAGMRPSDIAAAARKSGADGIGWNVRSLDREGVDGLQRITAANGLFVSTLSSAGYFLWSDPDQAAAQHALNLRLLDATAALGAQVLMVATGGILHGPWSVAGAHARVFDALTGLAERAAGMGVTLSLELTHPVDISERGCINSVQHGLRLLQGIAGLTLAADVFQLAWDPDLPQLPRLAPGRVPVLQLCNWTEPAPDRKPVRELPADGHADLAQLLRRWQETGWQGTVEFEMLDHHRRGRGVAELFAAAVRQIRAMGT